MEFCVRVNVYPLPPACFEPGRLRYVVPNERERWDGSIQAHLVGSPFEKVRPNDLCSALTPGKKLICIVFIFLVVSVGVR